MTDGVFEQALAVTKGVAEGAAAKERERIADWLVQRAKLIMNSDPSGAFELNLAASGIRSNTFVPITERDGGHGDDR